jgi:formylmethanofuran dehydrogenase subunit B
MTQPAESDPLTAAPSRLMADVPCPFCGCVCDDLELTVEGHRIVAVDRACEMARSQFLAAGSVERTSRIDGRPVAWDEAIRRAAELFSAARYPLVYGLSGATCEAQAAAVGIAELLGGVVDTSGVRASSAALQAVGQLTCTLGEIRHRADLIVAWGVDPLTTHPRFFERYAPTDITSNPPGGRQKCTLVVVDSRRTPTAELADERIPIRPGRDFEAATLLRALLKGLPLDAAQVVEQTGAPLAVWQGLSQRMQRSRYGVLLCGAEAMDSLSVQRSHETLYALVRELNDQTRFVCQTLDPSGNSLGAENVLAWRTGYPSAVDFSHGFPRFNPEDFAAERLLERREVDAALVICDDPLERLSATARQHLRAIPTVVVDWRETTTLAAARVALAIATIGVESAGTIFRLDGVPLTLRQTLPARHPTDREVLSALEAAIVEMRRASAPGESPGGIVPKTSRQAEIS